MAFYEGSIPEAIAAAQKTSKLFLVYVSDNSEESSRLEETWSNPKVLNIISEKAVALHLVHGSADGTNFAAVYPFSSTPSITAIAFGTKVWQHEGYISADELVEKLEEAIGRVQVQQAAAAKVLASMFGIPTSSQASSSQASSSQQRAAPSPEQDARASELITEAITEQDDHKKEAEHVHNEIEEEPAADRIEEPSELVTIPETVDAGRAMEKDLEQMDVAPSKVPEIVQEVVVPSQARAMEKDLEQKDVAPSNDPEIIETLEVVEPTRESSEEVKVCVSEVSKRHVDSGKRAEEKRPPSVIVLQIRMMDSTLVRGEFEPSDNLWAVKSLVEDGNAALAKMNYRFATPFPRKVFSGEGKLAAFRLLIRVLIADYEKSLLELDIGSRSVLIVVPSNERPLRRIGAPRANMLRIWLSYLGRWLLYLNPLVYLRRGQAGTAPPASSPAPSSAAPSSPGGSRKNSSPPKNSKWGSNIHTLKRDEDDDFRKKGNAYWNGNSTQFGGEDNNKPS